MRVCVCVCVCYLLLTRCSERSGEERRLCGVIFIFLFFSFFNFSFCFYFFFTLTLQSFRHGWEIEAGSEMPVQAG